VNRTTQVLALLVAIAGIAVFVIRSEKARASLEKVRAYARGRRAWAEMVGPPIALLILAVWIGLPAYRVKRDAAAERARVERAATLATEMRRNFVSATPEETAEWQRTRAEVADFGTPSIRRLRLAQAVARLAEDAGVERVRVQVTAPDSLSAAQPRRIAGQEFTSGYGLSLQGNGAVESAARLVEALPPSVEVQKVELNKGRLSYVLVVYEQSRETQ
jgi:hypothetical protein